MSFEFLIMGTNHKHLDIQNTTPPVEKHCFLSPPQVSLGTTMTTILSTFISFIRHPQTLLNHQDHQHFQMRSIDPLQDFILVIKQLKKLGH